MWTRIELTQEDIDRGCKSQKDNCPGVWAISRHLNTYATVQVLSDVVVFFDDSVARVKNDLGWDYLPVTEDLTEGALTTYATCVFKRVTPQELSTFVQRFDRDKPVEPIVFYMDIPEGCYIGIGD